MPHVRETLVAQTCVRSEDSFLSVVSAAACMVRALCGDAGLFLCGTWLQVKLYGQLHLENIKYAAKRANSIAPLLHISCSIVSYGSLNCFICRRVI